MRKYLVLSATCFLGACGGAGADVVSAPTPGNGSQSHSFANPTEAKTYQGIGGTHTYSYNVQDRDCCRGQSGQLYQGNATTARNSSISISYDPRDAIYTLSITDNLSGANVESRYQDPAQRTDFDGARQPQFGTPRLANPNVTYLEAGSSSGGASLGTTDTPPFGIPEASASATTLFVLKPGSETQYVTYAGYVRNDVTWTEETETLADETENTYTLESLNLQRGAFAFGELTNTANVPKSGGATYEGSMLATMVFNPTLDGQSQIGSAILPSYFQWVEGTANLAVDFGADTVGLTLAGTAFPTQDDGVSGFSGEGVIAGGATFSATGAGTINLANFGGFKGEFSQAGFVNPDGTRYDVNIAGSSLDGAFYGPAAEEVGGGFRIVGGTPDERIDILGAFIGK
ncbi:hypothetical protein B2G71_00270 [Novosphingobium sp. PC22D]|uniref:transferrin-binding protein-like solute binding protein n=1 Tax=Novosphingobium sp. PC22D TaxID=1962403 RepID=UPI000BEFFB77|nr:transferrin-binding protein-like solute binding protein [Novosphingobium sp. PC22D]PEQ14097.1 hypothetical protein B2G71_00270 [Novosphingobium sp. PC22D]